MFVANWNGEEIARSERCILVENSLYFPPDSIRAGALMPGNGSSQCYWKGGEASYFDVHAAGKVNPGAAWTYVETAPIAKPIENWIAFWQGVETRWVGDGEANPEILNHAIPSVAKALGVSEVHWRPKLAIPGVEGEFTGYRVDEPPSLVEIWAESGAFDREQLIDQARERAKAIAAHGHERVAAGDRPLGYIAVWGSALPTAGALQALREGRAVLDLGDEPEIVDLRTNPGIGRIEQ